MSAKLWCVVCQTTHSHLWMASDLVLHSTQLTVLDRLKGLDLELDTHCILCTSCYALVELWDKQIAAAAKTQQVLKGLIRPFIEEHLPETNKYSNAPVSLSQGKDSEETHNVGAGNCMAKGNEMDSVTPKTNPTGLPGSVVAVPDCLAPSFGRMDSSVAAEHLGDTDSRETKSLDPGVTAVAAGELDAGEENLPEPAVLDATDAVLEVPKTDNAVSKVSGGSSDVAGGSITDVTARHLCEAIQMRDITLDEASHCELPLPTSAPGQISSHGPQQSAAVAVVAARFQCQVCTKSFARRGSLRDHMAAHSGNKTYTCAECNMPFQYRDGLLVHRRRVHGKGKLHCPHCPVLFEKSSNLRRHLRVHTGERPFGCSFCSKRFAQSNGLKKHVRTQHADRATLNPD